MTLEELEKRLHVLEDMEAIKKLKARYAQGCDDNYNPDKLGELFTDDAVWDGGEEFGVYRGKKSIKEFFAQVSSNITFALHFSIMPDITIDGDKAYGRWYLWMVGTLTDGRAFWLAALYNEEYTRISGEWLIASLKAKVLFQTPYEEGWHKKRLMD